MLSQPYMIFMGKYLTFLEILLILEQIILFLSIDYILRIHYASL